MSPMFSTSTMPCCIAGAEYLPNYFPFLQMKTRVRIEIDPARMTEAAMRRITVEKVEGAYKTKVAEGRRIRGCSATTDYRSAEKAFAVRVADLVRRQQYARGGRLGSRGARRDASVLLSGRRTPYGTAGCVFCWGRMSAPPCRFISSRRRSGFPVAKVRGPNSN